MKGLIGALDVRPPMSAVDFNLAMTMSLVAVL